MILTDETHLVTDGPIRDLHEFAGRIGLKRSWFQAHPRHPHYDLTSPRMVARAIDAGALVVGDSRDLLRCIIRIPCISIHQPLAGLIFEAPENLRYGRKNIENRTFAYFYRGPLLIQATKKRPWKQDAYWSWLLEYLNNVQPGRWAEYINSQGYDYGAIIGVVDLVDCVDGHPSPWAIRGQTNWVLENPRLFGWPLPTRGWPGVYYPAEVLQLLHAVGNDVGWGLYRWKTVMQ